MGAYFHGTALLRGSGCVDAKDADVYRLKPGMKLGVATFAIKKTG